MKETVRTPPAWRPRRLSASHRFGPPPPLTGAAAPAGVRAAVAGLVEGEEEHVGAQAAEAALQALVRHPKPLLDPTKGATRTSDSDRVSDSDN